MKYYIKNLLAALRGKNPYQAERDDLADKLKKAGENISGLQDLYYNVVEKWETGKKQVESLQQLVENLRERIADKNAIIAKLQECHE